MSGACPRCRRPVAVARATCLYCGAELPKEAVAAAAESAEQVRAAEAAALAGGPSLERPVSGPERHLLVVEVDDQEPARLARLLGLTAYDAQMRLRLGGLQLHHVARDLSEAETEAERLRRGGLPAFVVAEASARAAPVMATGGQREGQALGLRTAEGALSVRSQDLMLVVKGPIRREYQPRTVERRKPTAATLEAGYRFHLHRRGSDRPLELDPSAFAFGPGGPRTGSSLIEIGGWLDEIAAGVPVDDGFRRLPPALGASSPEADALLPLRGARGASPLARRQDAPAILDNLGQFRFYSGWRAGVERLRR